MDQSSKDTDARAAGDDSNKTHAAGSQIADLPHPKDPNSQDPDERVAGDDSNEKPAAGSTIADPQNNRDEDSSIRKLHGQPTNVTQNDKARTATDTIIADGENEPENCALIWHSAQPNQLLSKIGYWYRGMKGYENLLFNLLNR
jgi:hypothetical protein